MVTRYPEVRQKLPEELRRPPVYSLLMTAILRESFLYFWSTLRTVLQKRQNLTESDDSWRELGGSSQRAPTSEGCRQFFLETLAAFAKGDYSWENTGGRPARAAETTPGREPGGEILVNLHEDSGK